MVSQELHDALRSAFAKLQADQAANPDFHPGTNNLVQNLVHPSMYPLVYGRSRFLADEVVGVDNAINAWAGKGEIIPRPADWGDDPTPEERRRWRGGFPFSAGGSAIPPSYWSTRYQWLPSNIRFKTDGGVQFTSYINNLHPTKYRDIYHTIEKLIEQALPMWDQCLAQYSDHERVGAGPLHSRFPLPDNPE